MINTCAAAYVHQIGTARTSLPRTNRPMPIIASDPAKNTAPTAVHSVGSRASSAAQTMAASTTMYTVTGTVIPSRPSCGQNHTSSATHAPHNTATAINLGRDRLDSRASGSSAPRKHKCANRNAANPNTKDGCHHGIANSTSPTAENTNAGISHRRSRTIGCAAAANANSSAIDALNAGCAVHWPVRSSPGGNRNATIVRKAPYAIPAQPAATHAPSITRGAYGVSMPAVDASGPAIDPILQKVLDAVPFRLSADDGVEAARKQLRDLPRRAFHPELRVEDRAIDGPGGPLNIRIYWPPTDHATPPVLVFFHGGGFVVGDLDTHDGTCRQHAVGADCVVVSVEYRLAPEHPYPAAIDDAWAATQWVAEHGSEIGADASRLAVAGDSAGGTISAVIAQRSRDNGGPPIRFQLLWYPATLWDSSLPSFTENADAQVLDRAAVAAFTKFYAGEIDLSDPPTGMAPGRAENLSGLPAAYIAVAGHDPLRDDGIRYGELLAAAGSPVEVHNAETLVHGYVGYAGVVPAATEATDRGLAALHAALHQPVGRVGP